MFDRHPALPLCLSHGDRGSLDILAAALLARSPSLLATGATGKQKRSGAAGAFPGFSPLSSAVKIAPSPVTR